MNRGNGQCFNAKGSNFIHRTTGNYWIMQVVRLDWHLQTKCLCFHSWPVLLEALSTTLLWVSLTRVCVDWVWWSHRIPTVFPLKHLSPSKFVSHLQNSFLSSPVTHGTDLGPFENTERMSGKKSPWKGGWLTEEQKERGGDMPSSPAREPPRDRLPNSHGNQACSPGQVSVLPFARTVPKLNI